MADKTIEKEGLHIKMHDNGDGTFSISTHDISGGAGVADSSIEWEGTRILMHDNGDGTFSITTTTTTGASDITVEHQGLHQKLHPTGINVTIGGIVTPTYAFVVNSI
jgi:hypothetical protein